MSRAPLLLAVTGVVSLLAAACGGGEASEPDLHVAVIHVAGMQKSATGAT